LRWRLLRSPWRIGLLLMSLPLWAPLFARRRWVQHGVAACFFVATLGEPQAHPREALRARGDHLRARLLAAPLAAMQSHRQRGDTVLIATGAFPPLVEGLLADLADGAPPVFGSIVEPGR
jgi:phosphatidylglycerophosphatase C